MHDIINMEEEIINDKRIRKEKENDKKGKK